MAAHALVPRSCLSLLLLAGLAAPLTAQAQIDLLLPAFGSPGSEVFVLGSGFSGSVAPRVWLEFPGESQKFRMRVLEWSDSEIHALVLSGVAGDGQLVVKPQHQDEVSAPFKMLKPQVVSFAPSSAVPGQLVTVQGASFGPERGRVLLFERPCRVVDWSDSEVTFRVPANVPDGDWTPRVANDVGESAAFSTLKLSGSPALLPPPFVKVRVDKPKFVAEGADMVGHDLGTKMGFDAWSAVDGVPAHLALVVPFAPATGKVPKAFSGASAGPQPILFELLPLGADAVPSLYVAQTSGLPWKVQLLGKSQGQVFGQLSGVLQRVSGPGPDQVQLQDGEFLVDP